MWTDHEKTERKIRRILGLLRLSSLQTYGENLNMEKLHDRDIVIASEPPFPAKIAFCRGPLQEEIEFFQEKK